MKQILKKSVSILLSCVMLASLMPLVGALAAKGAEVASGVCGGEGGGDNLVWTLDGDGTLTVSGAGPMADYPRSFDCPWYGYQSDIVSVVITGGVTSVGSFAFAFCPALASVTVPAGVTSIGENAFNGCTALTEIGLPPGLESIGKFAFRNCGLTALTLPEGLITVADYAFYESAALTEITLPRTLTQIGENAFYGCTGLKKVHISDIAAWCGADFQSRNANPLYYAHALYMDGEPVSALTVPEGVSEIGAYAFYGCTTLTSLTLPEGLTTIGNYAFYGCENIGALTVPAGLTEIGTRAFFGCGGLDTVTAAAGNPKYRAAGNCLIDTEAKALVLGCKNSVIPADGSVTAIGSGAFAFCGGLTEITVPDAVTKIGSQAFYNCTGLTGATLPGVSDLGDYAFYGCTALESVTLSDALTWIPNSAFTGAHLSGITLPESLERIEQDAFYGCTGLTEIVIPDSVTWISEYAFANCTDLTRVVLGNGIYELPVGVFSGCTGLREVTISTSVRLIECTAFPQDQELFVFFPGTEEQWWNVDVFCWVGDEPEFMPYIYNCERQLAAHLHLNAAGHTPGEAVTENPVAATCTEAGGYEAATYCTVCGYELNRDPVILDPNGHTPGQPVIENPVPPTCTEPGSYQKATYCAVCGNEVGRENVPLDPTGHLNTEQRAKTKATPTAHGHEEGVYCTDCDRYISGGEDVHNLEGERIPVREATWLDDETYSYCCANGDFIIYCTVCGGWGLYKVEDLRNAGIMVVVPEQTGDISTGRNFLENIREGIANAMGGMINFLLRLIKWFGSFGK